MDNQATPWRTKTRPGATNPQPGQQQDINYLRSLNNRRPMQYQDNVGPEYVDPRAIQQPYFDPQGQPQPQNRPPQQPYYDPYGQPQPQRPQPQQYPGYDQYGNPISPQVPPQQRPIVPPQGAPRQQAPPVAQPNIKKRVILYSLIGVVVILTLTFIASLVIFFMKFG